MVIVDVGEGNDCTIAAIMYRTCIRCLEFLYDSNEASLEEVAGIFVEEWRV